MQTLSRRRWLNGSLGGLALGAAQRSGRAAPDGQRLPREVWVASVGHMGLTAKTPEEKCRKMIQRMEETVPLKPDIVCTSEAFAFAGLPGGRPPLSECAEERTGPVLDTCAEFAKRHRCYVICSTYTREKGRYYNASVLLDRGGQYMGEYRKINPTTQELERGITPGPLEPPVFKTDFGNVGVQICYDVNWYDNWTKLGNSGAEIVFWPSAFGGGMMLNSLAWMNKYYVVTCTRDEHPTKIVDPLGQDVVSSGRAGNWVCAPVNLDYAVIQGVANFKAFEKIRKKYGRGFGFRILHVEALALVEGQSPGISVPAALKEFGIPTAREALADATRAQESKRPV